MKSAVRINPKDADAYLILGSALKQQGNFDAAQSALQSAISLDPANPGPYNALGDVLRRKGDTEGSRQAFAKGAQVSESKNKELGKMLQKMPR